MIYFCFSQTAMNSVEPHPSLNKPRFAVLRPVLASCLLLWVALFNRYPTVFSDTGSYIYTGKFLIAFPPFRSPGYSIFTKLTSLAFTPWLTIIAQAAIALYVLNRACAYLLPGDRKFCGNRVLGIIAVLVLLTSLPWLVSLLMPDFFAGIVFLTAFLLATDTQSSLTERILLAIILLLAVSSHLSLLPVAALYVLFALVIQVSLFRPTDRRSAPTVLAWLLVPIIAAGFSNAALNYKLHQGFTISPSKNLFLLASLVDDGLLADFLHANCGKRNPPLTACQYLSSLPPTGNAFLFQQPAMMHDIADHPGEAQQIVRGTLSAYPGKFIAISARKTWLQLISFRTGDEIRNYADKPWNLIAIRAAFPSDLPAFLDSRQSRGQLLWLANAAGTLHAVIFWLSLPACLAMLWIGRSTRLNQFFCLAILFLTINAAVCASLSGGIFDRYQSRVVWLIPLCLTLQIVSFASHRKRFPVPNALAGSDVNLVFTSTRGD